MFIENIIISATTISAGNLGTPTNGVMNGEIIKYLLQSFVAFGTVFLACMAYQQIRLYTFQQRRKIALDLAAAIACYLTLSREFSWTLLKNHKMKHPLAYLPPSTYKEKSPPDKASMNTEFRRVEPTLLNMVYTLSKALKDKEVEKLVKEAVEVKTFLEDEDLRKIIKDSDRLKDFYKDVILDIKIKKNGILMFLKTINLLYRKYALSYKEVYEHGKGLVET